MDFCLVKLMAFVISHVLCTAMPCLLKESVDNADPIVRNASIAMNARCAIIISCIMASAVPHVLVVLTSTMLPHAFVRLVLSANAAPVPLPWIAYRVSLAIGTINRHALAIVRQEHMHPICRIVIARLVHKQFLIVKSARTPAIVRLLAQVMQPWVELSFWPRIALLERTILLVLVYNAVKHSVLVAMLPTVSNVMQPRYYIMAIVLLVVVQAAVSTYATLRYVNANVAKLHAMSVTLRMPIGVIYAYLLKFHLKALALVLIHLVSLVHIALQLVAPYVPVDVVCAAMRPIVRPAVRVVVSI
jgi:hypothetical protein